jgi:glyceraldehyde-3-phosphate dehydrogenase (ferredoxin)
MNGHFKKDYEPYQTMGPLCGICDQRAAETLNRHADTLGFDAISIGGVLAWLMDLLDFGWLSPEDLGVSAKPHWTLTHSTVEKDSMHNAQLGVALLDAIVSRAGLLDFSEGVRKWARRIHKTRGVKVLDRLVLTSFGRKGWMVPNQYWTPGVLVPMAIMGKYYMIIQLRLPAASRIGPFLRQPPQKGAHRGQPGHLPVSPRLGRRHGAAGGRAPLPGIGSIPPKNFRDGIAHQQPQCLVFWESARNVEYVLSYMKRRLEVDKDPHPDFTQVD